jgi:hypothetical protein
MDAARLHPRQLFQFGDSWAEGVTVEQFPCGALAWITNCLLSEKRAAGWRYLRMKRRIMVAPTPHEVQPCSVQVKIPPQQKISRRRDCAWPCINLSLIIC